jgi:hypothetical protein
VSHRDAKNPRIIANTANAMVAICVLFIIPGYSRIIDPVAGPGRFARGSPLRGMGTPLPGVVPLLNGEKPLGGVGLVPVDLRSDPKAEKYGHRR